MSEYGTVTVRFRNTDSGQVRLLVSGAKVALADVKNQWITTSFSYRDGQVVEVIPESSGKFEIKSFFRTLVSYPDSCYRTYCDAYTDLKSLNLQACSDQWDKYGYYDKAGRTKSRVDECGNELICHDEGVNH